MCSTNGQHQCNTAAVQHQARVRRVCGPLHYCPLPMCTNLYKCCGLDHHSGGRFATSPIEANPARESRATAMCAGHVAEIAEVAPEVSATACPVRLNAVDRACHLACACALRVRSWGRSWCWPWARPWAWQRCEVAGDIRSWRWTWAGGRWLILPAWTTVCLRSCNRSWWCNHHSGSWWVFGHSAVFGNVSREQRDFIVPVDRDGEGVL